MCQTFARMKINKKLIIKKFVIEYIIDGYYWIIDLNILYI